MLKAIIFDMDGVIVNSEPLHRKAYFDMFEEFNLDVSNGLYESFTGKSTSTICKELCEIFDLSISHEKLMFSKRKHFKTIFDNDPEFQMIDGALSLIKNYFYNNLTLILASSASMTNINRIFKKFDLDKFFKAKISGADLKESKPNPEIFLKAAKLANTPKENCFVIEDSDNGVKAANDAGIYVFGYQNPLAADQTLKNANKRIKSFKELKEFI